MVGGHTHMHANTHARTRVRIGLQVCSWQCSKQSLIVIHNCFSSISVGGCWLVVAVWAEGRVLRRGMMGGATGMV